MSSSRTAVSAELSMGLVGPEQMIVPLMASLYYSCADPFAVRMAFHTGMGEPVEWVLARDLLAAALHGREGIGDVRAWPSAAPGGPAAGVETAAGTAGHHGDAGDAGDAGHQILNIAMTSPFGHAQFEASAAAIAEFLDRTYEIVPAGQESLFLDIDAGLAELLKGAGA